MNIRIETVLAIVTGKAVDNMSNVDEALIYFLTGRRFQELSTATSLRDNRILVREMMTLQYPVLAGVVPPTDFSELSLTAWFTEWEQRLGGKVLSFTRPS